LKPSLLVLAISLLLSGIAAGAFARPASLEGKWRLNAGESELLPGEAAPAELTMAITRDDGTVFRWTVTVEMPGGASGQTGFDGAIDGKPYPVAGRPGSTSSFSWTPDGALKQVSQSPGGIAVEICRVAPGGARMTCEARQTGKSGQAASYVEVFDKM
jgi:hypothetical protein